MNDKSERVYWWIARKAKRAGRWLDKNIVRMLFAAGAAGLSIYGHRQSEGTFLNSISAELFGIVLTAVIIDYVNDWQQEKERKKILIAQLSSAQRDVNELALIELRIREWLYDGSLIGANLEGAILIGANLEEADLCANLYAADLSGANLKKAYLRYAFLWQADLSGANLEDANLSGAELIKANLSGADLSEADLSGARYWTIEQLGKAKLLEGTIMPDGVQLELEMKEVHRSIKGPNFKEWKAQYLTKHRGTVTDERDTKSDK